ncbi:conserved hypothetical protein [Ricinus communis]|uniref:Uncharacterized protein n=1 Tax=Ricinus communis TaxID=3988 RepID=B9SAG7_RICCO|nr:conserved hypothetical protein [Ricinus communis]
MEESEIIVEKREELIISSAGQTENPCNANGPFTEMNSLEKSAENTVHVNAANWQSTKWFGIEN